MATRLFQNVLLASLVALTACQSTPAEESTEVGTAAPATGTMGQAGVADDVSSPNVVQIAASSADHTTLVKAVQTAELVNALSNNGPFTVFAPTNAAFEKLPPGTVEDLLTPEKRADLTNILEYHVSVGVLKTDYLQDGQSIEQVNGGKITITFKDGEVFVNGGNKIVASIPASNGIIHVIDGVLLPAQ